MTRTFRASALIAFASLALGYAPAAHAAFVPPGVQGIADVGTPTLVGGNSLSTATAFNFGALVTTAAQSGGFTALASGQNLAAATFTPSAAAGFTLGNAVFGTFTGTSATLVASSATTRDYNIVGTFTAGTGFGAGSIPNLPATIAVSFTQVGGAGTPVSASLTLTVGVVPEPASVAMVGLGLAGLGGIALRRRSK